MDVPILTTRRAFASEGDATPLWSRDPAPLLSLVVAGLNEQAIIEKNLRAVCDFVDSLEPRISWELIFIDDGSTDATGEIVERFAQHRPNVRVFHHETNRGLGAALRLAFTKCRGDYIITLDADLSFGPHHIPLLLDKIQQTGAKVVASSPYMKGGKISQVPWLRRIMTIGSNRFLSFVAKTQVTSLTPMVRAYDRRFIQSLDLRSTGMDINVEIMYKTMILDEPVAEIPAHMDWSLQRAEGDARQSKMKIMRNVFAILLSGFMFRPFLFFIFPGLVFLSMSVYANFWLGVHIVQQYGSVDPTITGLHRFDAAVAAAFHVAPHTLIVGGLTLIIAIQLISLGILALLNTNNFEQLFHLGTSVLRNQNRGDHEAGCAKEPDRRG